MSRRFLKPGLPALAILVAGCATAPAPAPASALKLSNRPPAPKEGNFNLTMRNCMPSQEIIEQRDDPPILNRVS